MCLRVVSARYCDSSYKTANKKFNKKENITCHSELVSESPDEMPKQVRQDRKCHPVLVAGTQTRCRDKHGKTNRGKYKMELYTQLLLFVGFGGFITTSIMFYERVKGGKELRKIIEKQNALLDKMAGSFVEVLKDHSGLNEDARITMKHLEQTFELQMKAIKIDIENLDKKVNKIQNNLIK